MVYGPGRRRSRLQHHSEVGLPPMIMNFPYPCYCANPLLFSAQNVMKARRGRGQRTRVALLGLGPFFVAWTLIPMYLALQPTILHHHLVPFIFYVGLINAYS